MRHAIPLGCPNKDPGAIRFVQGHGLELGTDERIERWLISIFQALAQSLAKRNGANF